jgi:hypothetical protein
LGVEDHDPVAPYVVFPPATVINSEVHRESLAWAPAAVAVAV